MMPDRRAKQKATCPDCGIKALSHTGSFWRCHACGLAITQTALRLPPPEALPRSRARGR
jgi:ribosomal protein L37AE/L43A